MMVAQFDALTQLFEQIMERLVRIETKLDTKADLATHAALEGRVRDLEVTRAARLPMADEMYGKVRELEQELNSLEKTVASTKIENGIRLDTTRKKVAAGGVLTLVSASVLKAIWDFVAEGLKLTH